MWTTITSRARTTLAVLTLLLTTALVVTGILFAVQWAFPAHMHTYQSYTLEVVPSAPWHPGQSLSLLWVPSEAQGGPDEPPVSVTCLFSLYGPYATQADAQANAVHVAVPPGDVAMLAGSAPPLTLSTDRSALAPAPVAYVLPTALAPGYYVAIGLASEGDSAGGASVSWVVEVAA